MTDEKPKKKKKRKMKLSRTPRRNEPAIQDNWRRQLDASLIKFTDPMKTRYLEEFASTGLKIKSALNIGIGRKTVNYHIDNDPDFAEAFLLAQDTYAESIREVVRMRGVEGWKKPIVYQGEKMLEQVIDERGVPMFTEDGKPIMQAAWVPEVSDRMLELEAKRVCPEYRDKQTIDLHATHQTGVLVMPAPIPLSESEFETVHEDENGEVRKIEHKGNGHDSKN